MFKKEVVRLGIKFEFRAAGNKSDLLESQLQSIILEQENKSVKQTIKIRSHEMLDTDFSILLFHDSMKVDNFKINF